MSSSPKEMEAYMQHGKTVHAKALASTKKETSMKARDPVTHSPVRAKFVRRGSSTPFAVVGRCLLIITERQRDNIARALRKDGQTALAARVERCTVI